MYVLLPVVEQETCSYSIILSEKAKMNMLNLANNMFCAGIPEGGKDLYAQAMQEVPLP